MSDYKIVFRCNSKRHHDRIMRFLKRFGSGRTATSGFYRLLEIAMVEEVKTNQLELEIRKRVLGIEKD